MQVILDSSFARPGSAPIWGGKKGEFRDWTSRNIVGRNMLRALGHRVAMCCDMLGLNGVFERFGRFCMAILRYVPICVFVL